MALVRNTRLATKPDLRPYDSAGIALQQLAPNALSPLAKYVLRENLSQVEQLRNDLLAESIDLFKLSGRLEVTSGLVTTYVAPPIIEEWPSEGRLIVDGLHRLWLARELGVKRVSCVFIRNVTVPLVPLPVRWDQILVYAPGQYPAEAEKRCYRFDSYAAAIATVNQATDWGVTAENYRYFFFRDFSPLGSSGIRRFGTA